MNCNDIANLYFTKGQKIQRTFQNQLVSKTIHHQDKTYLCWAFATATMLRQSLKLFISQHKSMLNTLVGSERVDSALKKLGVEKKGDKKLNDEKQSDFFHRQLRNELILLPIPKNPSNDNNQFLPSQAHYLDMAIDRVKQFNSISNLNLNFS